MNANVKNKDSMKNKLIDILKSRKIDYTIDAQHMADEILSLFSVSNHVFCPHCGNKRELIVETDINSDRVCKSRLCKGK